MFLSQYYFYLNYFLKFTGVPEIVSPKSNAREAVKGDQCVTNEDCYRHCYYRKPFCGLCLDGYCYCNCASENIVNT